MIDCAEVKLLPDKTFVAKARNIFGLLQANVLRVRGSEPSGFCAAIALLLLQLTACSGGAEAPVAITGKTIYQGMAIEDVRVRAFRLQGNEWEEFASVRSGYHGSFIVKTNPGMVRLEARGEIFRENRKIPLAGRVVALEVPSGIRRVERVVIELAPVPEDPGG